MAASSGRRATLRLLAACAAAPAAFARPAAAQEDAPYRSIAPQPVPGGDVIEVVEFFWYGCPYCHQLQPHFDAWLRRQPADVIVRRVPAVFRASWVPHARLYYSLEALGAVERLHQQVYTSYHVERTPLDSSEAIADWAEHHGLDRQRWLAVYGSDEITRRISEAREQLLRYGIGGTPSVVVDGRYLTSSGMTAGAPAMIPVLDGLIAQVRAQRGGAR